MVSRLEGVLIVAIVFFAGRGVLTDLSQDTQSKAPKEKELELFTLSFKEVNQTALLHTITARHMLKYPEKAVYEGFALYTPDLTLLSPYAVAQKRVILLDQNATIIKSNGARYYAGGAVYDMQQRRLELSKAFSFSDRYGDVNGTQMHYDVNEKEITGEGIKAAYEIE